MDILLIDEKIKNNLKYTKEQKLNIIKEIEELEKVLEYLTCQKYISLCEKQLVEKRELQENCMVELKFYFLDTSHIIDKYKKILSKPILHSNENKREKSDIVKEYIKIVNDKYKKAFYQSKSHKIDIIKEYLEIVKSKEKPLPPPPSPKIETLKEYLEIVKKLKKASKTKKILISHENEDNFINKYFEKDKYHYSMIDIKEILYYEPNKMICNGTNFIDCCCFTTRILNIPTSSDMGRVSPRNVKIKSSRNKK